MRADFLLSTLQVAVLAILLLLATVLWYGLSASAAPAPPAGVCGTVSPYLIQGDTLARRGHDLWRSNLCGSCHSTNMRDHLVGPALAGVTERWAAYPRPDLYRWIRSNKRLIDEGHPRAETLWREWKPASMPAFTNLTDEDIAALVAYIEFDPIDR